MARRSRILLALAGVAAVADPAWAQVDMARAWVASNGSNGNPCTRERPCRTFDYAVTRIRDGGEINCVDSAEYGPLITQRFLTVDCRGATARIQQVAENQVRPAVRVNGPSVLRGLVITGAPNADRFSHGISASGSLVLDQVTVQDITCGECYGLFFDGTDLSVTNSVFLRNGQSATPSGAIFVESRNYATGNFTRVRLHDNVNIALDIRGRFNTTSSNFVIADSQFTANGQGVSITSQGPTVSVTVSRTQFTGNRIAGLRVSGAQAVARLADALVTNNSTGVVALSGATLVSYSGNVLAGNGFDSPFAGTAPKS